MAERRKARGLAYRHWPEADRQMWQQLIRHGDVFEESGPLADARPSSLEAWRNAYGFFLGHLVQLSVDLDSEAPAERATLDRMRSYAVSLAGLAPRTQAGYFAGLYEVLKAAFSTREWTRLASAKRALLRRAEASGGARNTAYIPASNTLLKLGVSMIDAAKSLPVLDRTAHLLWRDGLIIAFLAAHPIRILNFGTLEIGETLLRSESGYRIVISAEAAKNHLPFDFNVAPVIAQELTHYLETCRRVFPGGTDPSRGRLWLSLRGKPWGYKQIGRRISERTEASLGVRVTPHQFRHAAATTLALAGDGKARLAKALLTHATPDLAERVYDRSRQYDFSCQYVELVDRLKREARQCQRRS